MGIIKDCPRGSMEKCTDKYGCVGACAAVEQFEKEWREESTQKREWVGLTDEEIEGAIDEGFAFGLDDGNVSNKIVIRYARAIEAMLKEKNAKEG